MAKKKNSPLIVGTLLTNNCSKPRKYPVTRITPHCVVGQVSGRRGCEIFLPAAKQASCNYVIGKDGEIWLNVDEANRAWTTSQGATAANRADANDDKAITFEIASDKIHPYAITSAAYESMISLMVDICNRYGKKRIVWIPDKAKALTYATSQPDDEMLITAHRWYANKSCPGDYIFSHLDEVATEVNRRLGNPVQPSPEHKVPFLVRVRVSDLNIRRGPGTNYPVNRIIKPGAYTITEVSPGNGATLWGKLKSGAGWISLDYTEYI